MPRHLAAWGASEPGGDAALLCVPVASSLMVCQSVAFDFSSLSASNRLCKSKSSDDTFEQDLGYRVYELGHAPNFIKRRQNSTQCLDQVDLQGRVEQLEREKACTTPEKIRLFDLRGGPLSETSPGNASSGCLPLLPGQINWP